jgi:CubicO group peptidase (beta-lactamase class C family)
MKIGSTTLDELESLFVDAARSCGTVGAQLAILVGDARADLTYGTANAELDIPMTVDAVTQLGSTSKLFNAAIVMSVVDEGKLDLDSPISDYLPELELGGEPAPATITLRRLLSMSAGLDFGPHGGFNGENALGRYIATFLKDVPLSYPPGEGFGYSNASVCIAAHAAEQATGMPWDTLLKARVFHPASLTQAANAAGDLAYVRVAVGHSVIHDGEPVQVFRPWIDFESQNPSGSGMTVAMSAHDLLNFGAVFLNGGTAATGNRVLSEAAVKAMMTPTTRVLMPAPQWGMGAEWGLGPTVTDWGGTEAWGHAGSTRGGSSLVLWFPDKHAVLAYTVNSPQVTEPFTASVTGDIADAVLGVRAPTPTPAPPEPLGVDHPERFAGTYTRAGVRIEITQDGDGLRYREFNDDLLELYRERGHDVDTGPLVDSNLVSLGGDQFLVAFPGFPNGIQVFFYGDDAQGRARNLNSGYRTSRRVE